MINEPTSAAEFIALNEKVAEEKKAAIKTLNEALHIHLCGMNRHERRAYLARHSRKAGQRREKALTQRDGA